MQPNRRKSRFSWAKPRILRDFSLVLSMYFLRVELSGALWGSPGLSLPPLGTLLEPFGAPQADFWRAGPLKSTKSAVLSRFSRANAPKTSVRLRTCPQNCSQTDEFQDRRRSNYAKYESGALFSSFFFQGTRLFALRSSRGE